MNLVSCLFNKKFTNKLAIQKEITRILNLPYSQRKEALHTLIYQSYSQQDLLEAIQIYCPSYFMEGQLLERPCKLNCQVCWTKVILELILKN